MICELCQTALEKVDLKAMNGKPQTGSAIYLNDERLLSQIRRCHAAQCCICRRVAGLIEQIPEDTNVAGSIKLVYSVTDMKGYFGIALFVHATSAEDGRELIGIDDNTLHFDLLPGSKAARSEPLSIDSVSLNPLDRTRSYIQRRMEACIKEHAECRKGYVRATHLDSALVQLVETDDYHCGQYAALSHCWGGMSNYRLGEDNFIQLTAGIPWSSLPKTYREAFQVALWLDIRHVWIDSLCIRQDSTEDWEYESAQMHKVYQHAQITISASAAANSDKGLFLESQRVMPHSVPKLKLRGLLSAEYKIVDQQLRAASIDDGPLAKRAWTLQERMLSGRLLHFGKEDVFWQCANTLECQSYPADTAWVRVDRRPNWHCGLRARSGKATDWGVDPSYLCAIHVQLALHGKTLHYFRQMWQNIVRVYSACDLTFQSDKLPAIGGLARWLQTWHGSSYFAGLWEEGMLFQLFWTVPNCRQENGCPSKRPLEYTAPSWSWASVIGYIEMPHVNTPDNDFFIDRYAKILGVELERTGTSFGRISGGSLNLRGQTYDITLKDLGIPESCRIEHNDKTAFKIVDREARALDLAISFDIPPGTDDREVSFLPLWRVGGIETTYGLLLERVVQGGHKYSRAGAITISDSACRELCLDIGRVSDSGGYSRRYSGSDLTFQGFQTLIIV